MCGAVVDTMTPSKGSGLRDSLLEQHEEIDRSLAALVTAYETGDHGVARQEFREFDARLSAHLAFEEERLLPSFAAFDPGEAERIAAEHRAIRVAIDELGVGADLHLTRLPAIRALADMLRAHARREDSLFYRWAQEHAPAVPVEPSPDASVVRRPT